MQSLGQARMTAMEADRAQVTLSWLLSEQSMRSNARLGAGGIHVEDELIRSADGLLINEYLIDPVHDGSCQGCECAPSTEPDATSFREGINFQQRLFCDLHLSNPRRVISSTMLSRRDNISSRPVDRKRAFFARLLCSSMTLIQFCLTTSSGYLLR